jgi:hypothetical protein
MMASESRQPTGIRLRDKSSPQRRLSALVAVLLAEPCSASHTGAGAACLLFAR